MASQKICIGTAAGAGQKKMTETLIKGSMADRVANIFLDMSGDFLMLDSAQVVRRIIVYL